MFQVFVAPAYDLALPEMDRVAQSPAVCMRAKHVGKDGVVVYTVWNRRSQAALAQVLHKWRLALDMPMAFGGPDYEHG